MSIEWYPGHMVTARKDAAITMRQTDVVIEVLDARVPLSSCNPMVEALRRENQRPALKILNKADAADPARTSEWLAYYNAQLEVKAIALSAKKAGEVQRIPKECLALAPGRGTRAKPLRLMILGVPNVGKSTLMNALLKRHVANVGDEPAITKSQMRHELSPGVWLVDTPGMLWPGVAQDAAIKLAATHSIGRNAYDDATVALFLGAYLLTHYRELLARRFKALPTESDAHALLAWIAKSRSLVIKGGAPDLEKAASILLNEFRSGALGRMTLEVAA
jgi:ribosome biogenesis GTPase A